MRIWRVFGVLLFALLIGAAGSSSAHVVRIAVPAVVPYGFSGGVFEAALRRRIPDADWLSFSFVSLSGGKLAAALASGEVDAVVATDASGASAHAVQSTSVGAVRFGLVYLDQNRRVPEDRLAQLKISFWGPEEQFARFFPEIDGPERLQADTYEDSIVNLLTHRADAVLGVHYSLWATLRHYGVAQPGLQELSKLPVKLWVGPNPPDHLSDLFDAVARNPISETEIDDLARAQIISKKQEALRITIPILPGSNDDAGNLWIRDLVTRIDTANGRVSLLGAQPFDRSMFSVVSGQFDVHLPVIEVDGLSDVYSGLAYVGPPLYGVMFNAYVTDPDVYDPSTGSFADGAVVATETSHAALLGAPFIGMSCLECGVRMVAAGRLDAFVFAAAQVDFQIEEEDLSQALISLPYRRFSVRAVARKDAGPDVMKWISDGVAKMKRDGTYNNVIQQGRGVFMISEPVESTSQTR